MNVIDTSFSPGHFLPRDGEGESEPSKTSVVGDSSRTSQIPRPDAGTERARYRASRVTNRTPHGRLARALVHGAGHVAVIGRNVEDSSSLFDEVIERINAHRIVRVAANADSETVARALLDGSSTCADDRSPSDIRSALIDLLDDARRERSPILVIADGADRATVEQLDRLRLSLEFAPGALGTVKLVLLGTPSLERTLSKPSARSLASRISARVEAPALGRLGVALLQRLASTSRSARFVTLATATAASIALMLPVVTHRAGTGSDAGDHQTATVQVVKPPPPAPPINATEATHPDASRRTGARTSKTVAPEPRLTLAATGLMPSPAAPPEPRAATTRPKPNPAATGSLQAATSAPPHKTTVVVASSGPAPAPPTAARPADVATYALQVGAFRDAANAARLERSLAQRFDGVRATRFERNGVVYHRVRVGQLVGRPAAERARAELTALGLETLWIRTSPTAER